MNKLDIPKLIKEGYARIQKMKENPPELYEHLFKKDLLFYVIEKDFPAKFALGEVIYKNQFVLLQDKELTSKMLNLILEDKDFHNNEKFIKEVKRRISDLDSQ